MSEPLGDQVVHIWWCRPEAIRDPALLSRYDSLISDDERQKQQRFVFAEHRHACLVTRALVRTTLSRYAPIPPAKWRFVLGQHGRPELAPGSCELPLRFNLSHTEGLIACAVTLRRDVGVDVEYLQRRGDTVEVADRFFAPTEVAALRALPKAERRERFFHYWTLKESYIKARGMGLALPLEKFAFTVEATPIRIDTDPSLNDDDTSWQFGIWRPLPQHLLALAVRRGGGPDLEVQVAEIVP